MTMRRTPRRLRTSSPRKSGLWTSATTAAVCPAPANSDAVLAEASRNIKRLRASIGVAPLLKVQHSVKRHVRVVSTARRSSWSAPVLLGSSRSYPQDASPILDISGPRNCPTLLCDLRLRPDRTGLLPPHSAPLQLHRRTEGSVRGFAACSES